LPHLQTNLPKCFRLRIFIPHQYLLRFLETGDGLPLFAVVEINSAQQVVVVGHFLVVLAHQFLLIHYRTFAIVDCFLLFIFMHHIVVGVYLVQFSQDRMALPNPLVDVLDHPVLYFLAGSYIALLEQPAYFGQS
jgi:hypothetical protein